MTPDEYQDIWIKDDKVSWYSETLKHVFWEPDLRDKRISFELSRRGLNKNDDPLLISVADSFERKVGDDIFTVRFEGDIPAAKKLIVDTINHLDQKQDINIFKIRNYFNSYLQKNNIQPDIQNSNKTPALESRNLNSKEKIMSDERQEDPAYDDYMSSLDTSVELKGTPSLSDEEKKQLSPKELAFMNAGHQRKLIADAIKSGECVCLPGKDGYADTAPAKNILNPDKFYHGSTLLYLKEVQRQNGFPTGEYITYQKIEEAKKEDKLDVFIEKGQKGISLHINEKNKTTGEYEDKHIRLFNIAQLSKPWEIKKWAEKQLEKEEQERIEYMKTQKGASWEPEPKKPKEPGPEIVCSSTEPEKYLGQYFAAVSMGSKFKVSPEQAAEFSEKMISALYAPIEPKVNKETGEIKPPPVSKITGEIVTNPFSLDKISIKANEECVNFMRDLRIQTQKQNQPEQKQEQTQSIGRGM